jgi:hypothetical protein
MLTTTVKRNFLDACQNSISFFAMSLNFTYTTNSNYSGYTKFVNATMNKDHFKTLLRWSKVFSESFSIGSLYEKPS